MFSIWINKAKKDWLEHNINFYDMWKGERKMKKIKVHKETAKFFKLLEATLLVLIMMFGILGCTSLTPFSPAGWLIEIMMMIMFLVLTKIVEKPDINNANGNEQHVVQQSHGKNKEDESSLLFLIIFISIVLAYSFVSTFVENYNLH